MIISFPKDEKKLIEEPCRVKCYGFHNHPLGSAQSLRQLNVLPRVEDLFIEYFEQGKSEKHSLFNPFSGIFLVNDSQPPPPPFKNDNLGLLQIRILHLRKRRENSFPTVKMFLVLKLRGLKVVNLAFVDSVVF